MRCLVCLSPHKLNTGIYIKLCEESSAIINYVLDSMTSKLGDENWTTRFESSSKSSSLSWNSWTQFNADKRPKASPMCMYKCSHFISNKHVNANSIMLVRESCICTSQHIAWPNLLFLFTVLASWFVDLLSVIPCCLPLKGLSINRLIPYPIV